MSDMDFAEISAHQKVATATAAGGTLVDNSDNETKVITQMIFSNNNATDEEVTIDDGTDDVLVVTVPSHDTIILKGSVDRPVLNIEADKTYTATSTTNNVKISYRSISSYITTLS